MHAHPRTHIHVCSYVLTLCLCLHTHARKFSYIHANILTPLAYTRILTLTNRLSFAYVTHNTCLAHSDQGTHMQSSVLTHTLTQCNTHPMLPLHQLTRNMSVHTHMHTHKHTHAYNQVCSHAHTCIHFLAHPRTASVQTCTHRELCTYTAGMP